MKWNEIVFAVRRTKSENTAKDNKELDLEVVSSLAAKKNSKGNTSIIISWYYMFQVLGTPQLSPLLSVWVSDFSDFVLKHIILPSFLKD